ncbi:MAG: carbohydrate porin, partial [Nitrospira sp.]|nr:carbohydrate porin [Nitrospira sp.]
RATAFARAGMGRTEDDDKSTHAWSTGFEVRSPFPTWTRDRFGIAFSRQVEVQRSESMGEGYYHHYLTDRFAVAFGLQWLFSGTNSVTGQKNEHVVIPGFRTTVNF